MKPWYQSTKLWYAAGTIAVVFIAHFTGMKIEELLVIAGTGITLIGGQAAADWGKNAEAVKQQASQANTALNMVLAMRGVADPVTAVNLDEVIASIKKVQESFK